MSHVPIHSGQNADAAAIPITPRGRDGSPSPRPRSWSIRLWLLGLFSPSLFFLVVDFVIERLLNGPEPSGRWLYITLLLGLCACICGILWMPTNYWKRLGLLVLSIVAMMVQVLAWGVYYLTQSGLEGIQ
mgnify:FL=1